MKKLILALVAALCFTAPAHAASLTIGNKDIAYSVPEGYMQGMGGKYDIVFSVISMALPPSLKLRAIYVPKKIDAVYTADEDAFLDKYLLIMTNKTLDENILSQREFAKEQDVLVKTFGEIMAGEELKEALNKSLSSASGGAIQIGKIHPLGTLGKADDRISYLTITTQNVNTRKGLVTFDQVMLGTLLLVEGKIVMLYQYQTLTSPDMVEPFKEDTLKVLESMFPQRSGIAQRLAQLAPIMLIFVLGGALAGGFLYYRKRKALAAPGTDREQK